MDLLGFVAIAGVFLVFGLCAMLAMITLCKSRCDK